MIEPNPTDPSSEAARKAIFAALVALQDCKVSVADSRANVAVSFGVTAGLVAEVEAEGLDKEWPPL